MITVPLGVKRTDTLAKVECSVCSNCIETYICVQKQECLIFHTRHTGGIKKYIMQDPLFH